MILFPNRIVRLQKRAYKIILDYDVENILESMEEVKILTIYVPSKRKVYA